VAQLALVGGGGDGAVDVADEPDATERGAHVDRQLGVVPGVEGEDDGVVAEG
jgi:hypothetical protein